MEGNFGRFPANVIHDGSEEVIAGMPNTKLNGGTTTLPTFAESGGKKLSFGQNEKPLSRKETDYIAPHDEGSAARYFYCAKASKKDRDDGLSILESKQTTDGCIRSNNESARKFGANSALRKNIHPTVKPVELMQYLVRLVSPKGATIIDIFNGSGSTGKAIAFENRERNADYKYIGIELDPEYCKISEMRIDYAINKYQYDIEEEIQENKAKGQMSIFDFVE